MAVARATIRLPLGSLGQFQLPLQLPRNPSLAVSLQWAPRHSRTGPCLAISVRVQCLDQRRLQSTTSNPGSQNPKRLGEEGSEPPPPRETLTRVLARALYQSLRSLGTPFRIETLRKLYQQNPIELVIALTILACLAVCACYITYMYFNYFYSKQFTRYPEPVANAMRRALYFSNYNQDHEQALKYYQKALALCDELKLDFFSDDVMGIKIQLAKWLEDIHNYDNAAKVLEALLFDCKRWVEAMEKSVKDKTSTRIPLTPRRLETAEPTPEDEEPNVAEGLWTKRNRILAKSVALSVKLANLYSDDHVMKQDLAHRHLMWAVDTALKELQRRRTEGVKEGEGKWLSSEEMGATLESLGHSYESKSQFHLALPLFFQALRLSNDQCHSAVLMNNIATCFAQHPIMEPGEAPVDSMMEPLEPQASATPEVRKASYLAAAHQWATNANQHATEPQGEKRTGDCDEACAVSLCNLADIANLAGRPAEARKRYEQAIALSKKISFAPGIAQAEVGLRGLPEPTS
ncbi:hypothetical protein B0T14DRAFT_280476 [Immersiella caudata]|uniref:Uncharacterized protein n=1 Tax=Immersiella caudata TaxID=314043 RepID=A0AA40BTV8_9PEZI|nr:hypothetical protein B0T14DRAFT_280476 [Immersiella caudata]